MNVGTHSCKTTILSWAAKKGTDIKMRKLMGYHSIGKQDPVFIYGRDNVAPVLREIEAIVQMISDEIFMPDVTRSGYFKTDEEQPERILEEPSLQDLRGDSSSEDSADEDNVEHKLCEDAVKDTVGDWHGDLDCDALPPNAELYMRHSVSRVFHVLADETGNFLACGRPVSLSYEKLEEVPKILHPICKQCFTMFQKHMKT